MDIAWFLFTALHINSSIASYTVGLGIMMHASTTSIYRRRTDSMIV
jgi:hypothetical protein